MPWKLNNLDDESRSVCCSHHKTLADTKENSQVIKAACMLNIHIVQKFGTISLSNVFIITLTYALSSCNMQVLSSLELSSFSKSSTNCPVLNNAVSNKINIFYSAHSSPFQADIQETEELRPFCSPVYTSTQQNYYARRFLSSMFIFFRLQTEKIENVFENLKG